MASTVQGLREILFTVKPPKELINRSDEMVLASPECLDILKTSSKDRGAKFYQKYLDEGTPEADEVYPNIYVGNYKSIMSSDYLKSKGITHVINLGQLDPFGVAPNIDPASLPGINYQRHDMSDWVETSDGDSQIKAFIEVADLMDSVMSKENDVKLLVNCFAGVSRSASCVATYLIVKRGMTAQDALTTMKKGRDVWPSNPFLGFLSKISNEKHGFENVIEKDFGDIAFRSLMKEA